MSYYTIVTEDGQTIWDLAIQEYGTIDMVWDMLNDNPGTLTDLNQDIVAGTIIKIQLEPDVKDKQLMNYFRTNKIKVNCRD